MSEASVVAEALEAEGTSAQWLRSKLLQAGRQRDRLEQLLLSLSGSLSMDEPARMASVFSQGACDVTDARFALAVLPESTQDRIPVGPDKELVSDLEQFESLDALRLALEGEPCYQETGAFGQTRDGRKLRSMIALPIRGHDTNHGALLLFHHRAHAFSERHIALADALALQFGNMIEIAESKAEQTRIATALQQSLLPPLLPAIPGLELAARYRPHGPGSIVGGDFYDVYANGLGGWDLLLGDSSGIGPEAAGLAGVVRYTAHAFAESSPPLLEVLKHLNTAVRRSATSGRFCSTLLVRISLDGQPRISLGGAGHPSPYLLHADGSIEPAMNATGIVLGIVEHAIFGHAELVLAQGDSLIFYTDGVTEARNPSSTFFGEEGLLTVLQDSAGRSAEGIARRLELAVLDHRGPRAADDMAIVVMRSR